MSAGIILKPETFERFMRMLSAFEGGRLNPASLAAAGDPPTAMLKVSSSTIGTYGYPAKAQLFDETDGQWYADANRPETVYLSDPTGAALAANEFHRATFVGFRGAASEACYSVAVRPDSTATVKIISGTAVGGYYPAQVYRLDLTTGAWALDTTETVYAKDPTGDVLVNGAQYAAVYGGIYGGSKRYLTVQPAVAGFGIPGEISTIDQFLGGGTKIASQLGIGYNGSTFGAPNAFTYLSTSGLSGGILQITEGISGGGAPGGVSAGVYGSTGQFSAPAGAYPTASYYASTSSAGGLATCVVINANPLGGLGLDGTFTLSKNEAGVNSTIFRAKKYGTATGDGVSGATVIGTFDGGVRIDTTPAGTLPAAQVGGFTAGSRTVAGGINTR